MQTLVAERNQLTVDVLGFFRVGEQIDVLRGADHFVRRQGEPANQRKPRVHLAQAGDDRNLTARTDHPDWLRARTQCSET
jgi:hypothetical protein